MLLTGALASIAVFLLFAALAFILGLCWWRLWHLPEALLFLTPVFGIAFLSLFLTFALHIFAGQTVIWLTFSLAFLAILYLVKQRLSFKKLRIVFFLMFLTYMLLVLPFLFINGWTITGYNVNNDPVFHNIMAEQFYSQGYKISQVNDGKTVALKDKLEQQGYPDSFHHLLGLAAKTMRMRSYLLFNFTEFFFLSLLTAVVYALLTTLGPTPPHSLFISVVAAASYLQLTYSFQGFAPQVALTPFLFATLSLIYFVITKVKNSLVWPSLSLVLAASLGIFSFTVFIWSTVFTAILLLWQFFHKQPLRPAVFFLLLATGVSFLLNPFATKNIAKTLAMANSFTDALGNLLSAKVPLLPVFSSWLAADHRLVPADKLFALSLIGSFIGLAGLVIALFKWRNVFFNLAFVSFLLTLAVLKLKAGPYYFAKSLQPFSVLVVILALCGFFTILAGKFKLQLLLRLVFAVYLVFIFGANFFAFKSASPAPKAVFHELEVINKSYGLKNDWLLFIAAREDWGRYLLTNFKVVSPQAIAHRGLEVAQWRSFVSTQQQADFDSFKIPFQQFKWLVIAKSQDKSAVSPIYQLVYQGKYFNAYVKRDVYTTKLASSESNYLKQHLPLEIWQSSDLTSPYLKLYPSQEVTLKVKPAEAVALLARITNSSEVVNNSLQGEILILLDNEKQTLPLSSFFQLRQVNKPVKKSLRLKNISNKIIEVDWLELLKKPYSEQLIIKYNQYLKQRRVAVE